MTKPITIRLELPDYKRLEGEAKSLGMRPGTLAKVLLHGSLTNTGAQQTDAALAALDRLAALSVGKPMVDVVQLVHEARMSLGEQAS
ncbi:MAG: hypothetical protein ACR2GX_01730 [Candidatus Dormibacteria bacterium]